MIEEEQRAPHWRATSQLAGVALGAVLAVAIAAPLAAHALNSLVLFGFPLGFYFAAQGIFLLLIGAGFWLARRQEQVDRRHGATEDS